MNHYAKPDSKRIWADWRVLCKTIGERRAGTAGEAAAARYLADRFRHAGAEPRIEPFPCTSLRAGCAELAVHDGRRWRPAAAHIVVGAPGTPGGRAVEGEPVWLEMPEDLGSPRLAPRSLAGKVAMIFGPMPTNPAEHTRLLAATPLATVHVDERLPFAWCKNDGTYPYWVRRYGWPTFVTVSYLDAWRWRMNGLARVRVRSSADLVRGQSQNVLADLAGDDPAEPMIVLGAHHDTQCNNVGADDNAAGCVLLLEAARLLAPRPRRRTIRFVSFGTEEQLSVGSGEYVSAHRRQMRRVGMMLNFDGVSSPLGHFHVLLTAGPRPARWVRRALAAGGLTFRSAEDVSPFVDAFAFATAGVPTVGFYRGNVPGGRWQHHSVHDNLRNVSAEPICRLLDAVVPMIDRLANMPAPPFDRRRDAAMNAKIRKMARELLGVRVR